MSRPVTPSRRTVPGGPGSPRSGSGAGSTSPPGPTGPFQQPVQQRKVPGTSRQRTPRRVAADFLQLGAARARSAQASARPFRADLDRPRLHARDRAPGARPCRSRHAAGRVATVCRRRRRRRGCAPALRSVTPEATQSSTPIMVVGRVTMKPPPAGNWSSIRVVTLRCRWPDSPEDRWSG